MNLQEKKFLVEELQSAYVATIDDDRLEEWPDFFVDGCALRKLRRCAPQAGVPVVAAGHPGKCRCRLARLSDVL